MSNIPKQKLTFSEVSKFLKDYGFVYPAAEIYGGMTNTYHFGPSGTILKDEIKNHWKNYFKKNLLNFFPFSGSVLTPEIVLKSSMHVENFEENSGIIWKIGEAYPRNEKQVLAGELKLAHGILFSMPLLGKKDNIIQKLYLQPETAQSIFTNFNHIYETLKIPLPFAVGQVGKAFRKETSTNNFILRCWEFEQLETEYFFEFISKENSAEKLKMLADLTMSFMTKKLDFSLLNIRKIKKNDATHYAKNLFDIEYKIDNEWVEVASIADRTDFDIQQHNLNSNQIQTVQNSENESIVPHIVESSLGVERLMFCLVREKLEKNEKGWLVLKLQPKFCLYQVAILPLIEKFSERAKAIYTDLQQNTDFNVAFHTKKNIGKRYKFHDAIGTKYCITIDEKTDAVTIRDRDTMKQESVLISELKNFLINLNEF